YQKLFVRQLPERVRRLQKELDPLFVSPQEKAEAAEVPAAVRAQVGQLLSEDVDTYLRARRRLLAWGPGCKALVAERARRLRAGSPGYQALLGVLTHLEAQVEAERRLRMIETVRKRLARLKARAGKKNARRLACLLSRRIIDSRYLHIPHDDP